MSVVLGIIFTFLSLFQPKRKYAVWVLGIYSILVSAIAAKAFLMYFVALFILEISVIIIRGDSRTLMEYMILNTLWTKQVNKWPDLSILFTFGMNFSAPSEKQAFQEAGAKLIGEGLITETSNGQYALTIRGFEYCKKHYKKFPPEQWWPEETINEENLKMVIKTGAIGTSTDGPKKVRLDA
ncbi:MAG: hypothetical protein WC708_11750 [Lentisphaeria bacterium]